MLVTVAQRFVTFLSSILTILLTCDTLWWYSNDPFLTVYPVVQIRVALCFENGKGEHKLHVKLHGVSVVV